MKVRMVHVIANVLRKVKLLQYVDYIFYIKNFIISRKSSKQFKSTHGDFATPPAHLAFDAYGHINLQSYFDSGVIHSKVIAEIIHKEIMTDNIKILEWGCGPGRVIRHLKADLSYKNVELYGTDNNAESINWCSNNIKGIKFFINKAQPPIHFEKNLFDCVYAISVFTHLSEVMHFEWIKEMKRVLKPNGLIIITTHGDSATDRLQSYEIQLYNLGKLVVRGNVKEGKKWYLAYHPTEFIRDKLLKGFDIVSHNKFSPTQDIWVARKNKAKTNAELTGLVPK